VQLEADAQQATKAAENEAQNEFQHTAVSEGLFGSSHEDLLESGRAGLEAGSSKEAPHPDETEDMLRAAFAKPPANAEDFAPHFEEAAHSAPKATESASRLSGLRGLVSAADIKRIGRVKQEEAEEPPASEDMSDAAMPAPFGEATAPLAGLRGLVAPADLKELTRGLSKPEAGVPVKPVQARAASVLGTDAEQDEVAPAQSPAKTSSAEPMPDGSTAQAENGTGKIARKRKASRPKLSASARAKRQPDDEVQILPAKRGQYRNRSTTPKTRAGKGAGPAPTVEAPSA